ncbi:MAG: MBOAT family protein [Spirochaetales bacterium]|nr:MBOAT family protein [Spirochaetales bacterium]
MVFSSLTFIYLFLPAVLALHYASRSHAWRNGVLTAASLFFYAWGEPVWVILLLFSAAVDYFHGRLAESARGTWKAKAAVASSLVLNLGLLGAFKYSGFVTGNLNALLGLSLPVPEFNLPIGISFYTFQTISYTIDCYRGHAKAQKSFGKFLLYVSLFPQLVAGPIVRYVDIARDVESRRFDWDVFASGAGRFALGLAKKVALANAAGAAAVPFLDADPAGLPVLGAWYGIMLFAFQIYFDFSGYSDMAIGLGRMFGFSFKENFAHPYVSRSATEFWRRWHMSLGSFFRDYLYIPLGGNRRRAIFNIIVVWALTGLWHGASWNFVVWGLYWGALIAMEKAVSRVTRLKAPAPLGHAYLLVAALVGWVLFHHVDLGRGLSYLSAMFAFGTRPLSSPALELAATGKLFLVAFAALASTPLPARLLERLGVSTEASPSRGRPDKAGRSVLAPVFDIGLVLLSTALLAGQSYNPFLYFRF